MVASPKKPTPAPEPVRELPVSIQISDREVIRIIVEEAAKTDEPLAKVAARCLIRYFEKRQQPITANQ